jgi:H+/Cl- antiporter ClcA
VNVSQQVAAALSVAVLGAVSSSRTTTLLAHGRSELDALDGGYRLAFTIALASVLIGMVVGLVILTTKSAPHEHPEVVSEPVAVSETMIAEVL